LTSIRSLVRKTAQRTKERKANLLHLAHTLLQVQVPVLDRDQIHQDHHLGLGVIVNHHRVVAKEVQEEVNHHLPKVLQSKIQTINKRLKENKVKRAKAFNAAIEIDHHLRSNLRVEKNKGRDLEVVVIHLTLQNLIDMPSITKETIIGIIVIRKKIEITAMNLANMIAIIEIVVVEEGQGQILLIEKPQEIIETVAGNEM